LNPEPEGAAAALGFFLPNRQDGENPLKIPVFSQRETIIAISESVDMNHSCWVANKRREYP